MSFCQLYRVSVTIIPYIAYMIMEFGGGGGAAGGGSSEQCSVPVNLSKTMSAK